jgi:hypothetical protein
VILSLFALVINKPTSRSKLFTTIGVHSDAMTGV